MTLKSFQHQCWFYHPLMWFSWPIRCYKEAFFSETCFQYRNASRTLIEVICGYNCVYQHIFLLVILGVGSIAWIGVETGSPGNAPSFITYIQSYEAPITYLTLCYSKGKGKAGGFYSSSAFEKLYLLESKDISESVDSILNKRAPFEEMCQS